MKAYVLYGARMTDRAAAHAHLRQALDLPDYYGENLDALYDCLTELGPEAQITLVGSEALLEQLGDYGKKLLATLRDGAEEAGFRFVESEPAREVPETDLRDLGPQGFSLPDGRRVDFAACAARDPEGRAVGALSGAGVDFFGGPRVAYSSRRRLAKLLSRLESWGWKVN